MEKIIQIISDELDVKYSQVENTVKLIDEGNTIPFIARYRKEVTGGLSDEQLRDLGDRLNYLRNLENRKEEVKNSIEEQGKLTDDIIQALQNAKILAEVEDIYRPYKQKKRTRATVAKEKGLEPLAEIIANQEESCDIEEITKDFINIENGVETAKDAIAGAMDIIAENISDNATYRKEIKRMCYRDGLIVTKAVDFIPFFFGFTLAASLGINLVSATLVAALFALINYKIKMLSLSKPAVVAADDLDDDDEEDI